MKKLFSLLIVAALAAALFCLAPTAVSAEAITGSLGGDVTYSYDPDTKVLTISGTGATNDFTLSGDGRSEIVKNSTIKSNCTEVVVEEGVTYLGKYCCTGMQNITKFTFPTTLTEIADYFNNNNPRLAEIVFSEGLTKIGANAFQANNGNGNAATALTLPSTLETIGDSAFKTWKNLTSLNIPGSVKTIGNFAFNSCYALETLTLNEGLETIGEQAFTQLIITEVTIPASVTNMVFNSFDGCNMLEAYRVAEGSPAFAAKDGVLYTADHETLLVCPSAKTGEIVVDSACKSIGESAFNSCRGVTSITVPDGVEIIGNNAFAYSGITEITIPSSVTSGGTSWFYGCPELKTANVNAVLDELPQNMFAYCSALETVVLGDGVKGYSYNAFSACSSLTDVTVIPGITRIPESCFNGCSSLADFVIPETVTSIGRSAFESCSALAEVTLPEGLTSIDMYAFRYCSSLTEVTVPEGITTLPGSLFQFCSSLKKVTVLGDLTQSAENCCINSNVFGSCPALEAVYFRCPAPDPKKINSDAFNNTPLAVTQGKPDTLKLHYLCIYPDWNEVKPFDTKYRQYNYVEDSLIEMIGAEIRQRPEGDAKRDIRFIAKVIPVKGYEIGRRYVDIANSDTNYVFTLDCPLDYRHEKDGSVIFTVVVTGIAPQYHDVVISVTPKLDLTGEEYNGTIVSEPIEASVNGLENGK